MDDLTPFFSPKAAKIIKLFREYDSIPELLAAHPEISEEDAIQVTAEVMNVIGSAIDEMPPGRAPRKRGGKSGKSARRRGEAWQLKIALKGSKPPIWRRVVVPPTSRSTTSTT
jgi:hypothetical protein